MPDATAAVPAFERLWFELDGDACLADGALVSRREFLGRAEALARQRAEKEAREAMRLAGHKLPVKTKFVMRED